MNKLTKQWFDDVNRDVNDALNSQEAAKVFYKKPSASKHKDPLSNGKLSVNKNDGNISSSSKILLESTDDEDET